MSSDSGGEERFHLEVAAVVCASLLAITNIPLLFKVIKELYPANDYDVDDEYDNEYDYDVDVDDEYDYLIMMLMMNMIMMLNMIFAENSTLKEFKDSLINKLIFVDCCVALLHIPLILYGFVIKTPCTFQT